MSTPLLHRVAAGDSSAVEQVIDTHGRLIWALALRMLTDRGEAEDAVQEIFVKVWQHAQRYDAEKGSEQQFVVTLARRHLIDRIRRRNSGLPLRQVTEEEEQQIAASSEINPSQSAERAEQRLQIRRLMFHLQPKQRQVLTLSMWEGCSHAEIAQRMQLPLGTVKSHARRGLERLRQLTQCSSESG